MLNNDLYFDSTFQFNRFLDKCVEIGFGSEATIYAIDHKTAFKYYDCMPQIIIDEGITKFNDIQNDTYVFAKNIVFVEGNSVGTLMPQIHAKDLTHAD